MPLTALLLGAGFARLQREKPVLLRLKPVVGHRLEFQFTLDMTMRFGEERGEQHVRLLVGERVIGVKPDRVTFRRLVTAERFKAKGPPAERGLDYARMTSLGRFEHVTDLRFRPILPELHTINYTSDPIDVVFPEQAVAPGESWEGLTGPTRTTRLRYSLRGTAWVRSREIALIDVAEGDEVPPGQGLANGSLFAIDLADGRWLRCRTGYTVSREDSGFTYTTTIARTGAPDWPTILAAFPPKR